MLFLILYYNIPSNNRELQQAHEFLFVIFNYNIPSNNRELQLIVQIPLNTLIITYQVITGNYSGESTGCRIAEIITYQVITGNYSYPLSKVK